MSNDDINKASIDVDQAVSAAKRILLGNKVQQFTGDNVVMLASIILTRETELDMRTQQEAQNDERV